MESQISEEKLHVLSNLFEEKNIGIKPKQNI